MAIEKAFKKHEVPASKFRGEGLLEVATILSECPKAMKKKEAAARYPKDVGEDPPARWSVVDIYVRLVAEVLGE